MTSYNVYTIPMMFSVTHSVFSMRWLLPFGGSKLINEQRIARAPYGD